MSNATLTARTPIITTSTQWMVVLTVNGARGNKAQPWELPTYATSADEAAIVVAQGFRKPITILSVTPMAD